MREKERRGNVTILFPHLWEFFIIELGLYIPMMGFLKIALGLHEQASWMHTHLVSFVELS